MAVQILPYSFLLLLTSFLCGQTLAIHIEIRPDLFVKVKDDAIQISCVQNNEGNVPKEIFNLEIAKDGNPIVLLRQNSKLLFTSKNNPRLKAVGHIDPDVSQSFLNLTLMTPRSEDSGVYTCVMDCLDEVNIIKVEKESKNLTEQKLDMQSIETSLAFLKEKISSTEKKCSDQVKELKETINSQSELIQNITHKESFSTAFSVANKYNDITTMKDRILILPDILMIQGTGYNVSTGVFTAPTRGLYAFHVMVNADYIFNTHFHLDLMAQGNVTARLATDIINNHFTQSSISSAVELKAGDTVYAVMRDNGFHLYHSQTTMFTGYLIKAW